MINFNDLELNPQPNFRIKEFSQAVIRSRSAYQRYFADRQPDAEAIEAPVFFLANQKARENVNLSSPSIHLDSKMLTQESTAVAIGGTIPATRLGLRDEQEELTELSHSQLIADTGSSLISDHEPLPVFVHHPFRDIWLHPRTTFRFLTHYGQIGPVLLILLLTSTAASRALNFAQAELVTLPPLFDSAIKLFAGILVFGIAAGWLLWRVESSITASLGRLLGGHGSNERIRQAIIWSYLPLGLTFIFQAANLLLNNGSSEHAITQIVFAMMSLYTIGFSSVLISEGHRVGLLKGLMIRLSSYALVFGLPLILVLSIRSYM